MDSNLKRSIVGIPNLNKKTNRHERKFNKNSVNVLFLRGGGWLDGSRGGRPSMWILSSLVVFKFNCLVVYAWRWCLDETMLKNIFRWTLIYIQQNLQQLINYWCGICGLPPHLILWFKKWHQIIWESYIKSYKLNDTRMI